ncbi:MAG: cyanophycin synthetase [bacterium]|nr:cyanophycin synthetase [bacterium]
MICLFGAPGERDRQKRPQMGSVVHRLADIVILTDDDAAGENRRQIINDVLPGIPREE